MVSQSWFFETQERKKEKLYLYITGRDKLFDRQSTISRRHRDELQMGSKGYSENVCIDSWSLSHLGYLYPGTTPVMIKLDHNRSCPWV